MWIPALFLMVLAGLFLSLAVISLPMMVGLIRDGFDAPSGIYNAIGISVFLLAVAISNGLVILGSIAMLCRRWHALAKCAAITASIPILSPFYVLGIPFAIWARRLLQRPDVQSTFS